MRQLLFRCVSGIIGAVLAASCTPIAQQNEAATRISVIGAIQGCAIGVLPPSLPGYSTAAATSTVRGQEHYTDSPGSVTANSRQLSKRLDAARRLNKQLAYLDKRGASRPERQRAKELQNLMKQRIDEDIATARAALSESDARTVQKRELEEKILELERARKDIDVAL